MNEDMFTTEREISSQQKLVESIKQVFVFPMQRGNVKQTEVKQHTKSTFGKERKKKLKKINMQYKLIFKKERDSFVDIKSHAIEHKMSLCLYYSENKIKLV